MKFILECVDPYIPEIIQNGILYWSKKYEVLIHNCACGCGFKTIIPVHTELTGWSVEDHGDTVTIRPSILNPICKAHYYINKNEVQML